MKSSDNNRQPTNPTWVMVKHNNTFWLRIWIKKSCISCTKVLVVSEEEKKWFLSCDSFIPEIRKIILDASKQLWKSYRFAIVHELNNIRYLWTHPDDPAYPWNDSG